MHGLHGRLAVFVGGAKERSPVPGDTFDVKDLAGDEALQEIVRLQVAELVKDRPECVGCFDLANADCRGVGARLQQPWAGNMAQEVAEVVVVEDRGKFWNGNTALPGTDSHREFVTKVAGQ